MVLQLIYQSSSYFKLFQKHTGLYLVMACLVMFLPQCLHAQQVASDAKTLTLVADKWCPYNCDADSDKPGFMIEIAKQVFEPLGYKVVYMVMPWERAISETRRGNYNAIVAAGIDDAPDFIFPAYPVGYTSNLLYVRSDSTWKYTDINSLKNISLGVIDGYTYERSIDKYIAANSGNPSRIQSVSGDTALEQNFKKLELKRIDAYLENMYVAQKYIADNDLWGKFKVAGQLSGDTENHYLYIAFSPSVKGSGTYARILSDGVDSLRRSGRLRDILNKYNVVDWQDNK
jgi:polar amino acid transport system substrate-binding protein